MGRSSSNFALKRRQRPSLVRQSTPQNLAGLGAGLGSDTGALCEMFRQIAVRLDRLTEVMSSFPVQMTQVFQMAEDLDLGKLTHYIRLSLASVPINHQTVTVACAPAAITPIINNPLGRAVPMMVTNDDNGQLLRWGSSTLTAINGAILSSEKSIIVTVPPNSYLFAIFPLFTSTVSISRLGIP